MANPTPKEMEISHKVFVRNVKAESFECAKLAASEYATNRGYYLAGMSAYAVKEVDGSYTVEFR